MNIINHFHKLNKNEQNFLKSKKIDFVDAVEFLNAGKTKIKIEGKGVFILSEDWMGDITAKKVK